MNFEFLQPVSDDFLIEMHQLTNQALGKKIIFHSVHNAPELKSNAIAIIGVLDNRGMKSFSYLEDLEGLRATFYKMFPGNWSYPIYDLGDIIPGNTLEDTYYALKTICSQLIKKRIVPIVIGGGQDLTYAMYRAYDQLDQMVNIATVDYKFDFENGLNNIPAENYFSKIIIDEPNNLFNFSNIGYQTYFNSQEEIDLIEKLYFEAYRLGEVSSNITLTEPVFRDSDLVSIDMRSVKSSDSGNTAALMPNGFDGKEICALARYAGISDKVSAIGVFNHTNSPMETVLIAQIIWYFIEGFNFRSHEYPFGSRENFIKYIVPVEDDELIFYKSDKTDRWWIEIPFYDNTNNKLKRNTLLPCTNDDYLMAIDQEIPSRWWKAQRKNCV